VQPRDADLPEHPGFDVFLHHERGHLPPSESGSEERMLRAQICKAPSLRRQHSKGAACGEFCAISENELHMLQYL
jgi:hypothetical protein